MHRSGTSCLAGSLQAQGVVLGEVFTQNPHNLKGNRENEKLMLLQEKVLAENGGSWHEPPLSVDWSKENFNQLCKLFTEYASAPIFGFKDPRTLITFSGIKKCLPLIKLAGTFRNPYSVAKSLEKRNPGMATQEQWLDLWNIYNLILLDIWNENPFPIIDFDTDDETYKKSLSKLYSKLDLSSQTHQSKIKKEFNINDRNSAPRQQHNIFFDSALRSCVSSNKIALPAHIRSTYEILQKICI